MGGTETVHLLMDRGADVTLKDVELRSVLHAAIGNSSTMEVLTKVRKACEQSPVPRSKAQSSFLSRALPPNR